MTDRQQAGFKDRTRVGDARARLLDAVEPHSRTDIVPLTRADGRTLAEPAVAPAPVPGYDRAAMDGYAVRAEDTFSASDRSPAVLRRRPDAGVEADGVEPDPDRGSDADPAPLGPREAARVHTGSELPDGADAVVKIERVETVGDEVEVFDAVAKGENVGETGEDVRADQRLYDPGHRLRPSDLGLLKSVGITEVTVREPPTVGVIPTGEELVEADPDPGEVVETNGLTVSRLAARWGGAPTYRNTVTDDFDALRAAVERDLTKDVIVTTGGSSVGERDLLPEVIGELGDLLVHGVALKPGHPVALGVVRDTPVVCLPGYPVACIVNAVQFLRPALKRAGGMPVEPLATREATLTRKVASEPGTRTFARVRLDEGGTDGDGGGGGDENGNGSGDPAPDDRPAAIPTRASGAGVLSSVALADGWVVVPEGREGYDAGETVAVELWEARP